jgi:ABC-type spermidine/putrescine transport system permease subunit I
MSLAILTIGVGTTVASGYWNLDRFFNNPGTLRTFADSFFVAMIIVGLSCIVISLLGCALYKIESKVLPACYGSFLIPIWIIFVVLASTLGSILRPGTTNGFS